MDDDLKKLEQKLSQLLAHCQALKAENAKIKQDLLAAQEDRDKIKQNVARASSKIESLIEQLPESDLKEIL